MAATKVTLEQMHQYCVDEATRIRSIQSGLVRLGVRDHPDENQMQTAKVLDAIRVLVELVSNNEPKFRKYVGDMHADGKRAAEDSERRADGAGGNAEGSPDPDEVSAHSAG